MDFVYKPEGAEEQRWRWAPGRMTLVDAELAEDLSGQTHGEWAADATAGSIKAIHVLLFLLLRQDRDGLTFDSVSFSPDEVGFDFDDDQVRALLELAEAVEEPTPLQVRQVAAFRERLGLPPKSPSAEEQPEQAPAADVEGTLGEQVAEAGATGMLPEVPASAYPPGAVSIPPADPSPVPPVSDSATGAPGFSGSSPHG